MQGKLSEKQTIHLGLSELYAKSSSYQQFLQLLLQSDLTVCRRGGTIAGVQGNKRRYRLKTLGFSADRVIKEQQLVQTRLQDLSKEKVQNDRSLDR